MGYDVIVLNFNLYLSTTGTSEDLTRQEKSYERASFVS